MYVTGTPLREPIVYGGPFVMTTAEQMRETQRRYARGEMGRLGGGGESTILRKSIPLVDEYDAANPLTDKLLRYTHNMI
jgi:hypothetical protein